MPPLGETVSRPIHFPFGFPVHREGRGAFLAGIDGEVREDENGFPVPSMAAMRTLADRLNRERDFSQPGTKPARAGELLAWGLLCDVYRYLIDHYAVEEQPGVLVRGLKKLRQDAGEAVAEGPWAPFVDLYPPEAVATGRTSAGIYLASSEGPLTKGELVSSEMLILRLCMDNPALRPYLGLFEDSRLRAACRYADLTAGLEAWLDTQPPLAATGQTLPRMLRIPIEACPDSLEAQLDFVRNQWRTFLPSQLLERVRMARGVLREETMMRGLGPGPVEVMRFDAASAGLAGYPEVEAFSPDKAWMPNVVLMAKTVYVWLHQLSRQYGRAIERLDQIPDEELDKLRNWGFNALWLIGIWERSEASKTIKRMTGNPEAEASAYSLYDYAIAQDLGGEGAYKNLSERAWARGIRLASDMVPNHVGIYSKWVVEHPDWFVQLPYPPFPGYTFNGPDLSSDSRVGLYIEDGYWDRRDAAVVFKRVDHWTGHTTYIYHGNDGTSMPWNDTAQLNYLLPEVREAVIQTILHVARHFPIIRFDAAMTLAKKHYQRLWFPLPGDGGAIPSRAEHGMDKPAFDDVFPKEFWREVVDRVAAEVPDTLLLAEAFWLMEGYFVRTLGMHRVYNSAFMNMLKLEDNGKFRQTVKNVLEFSPEILQRFVNFMNNPDEDTAEAQFGKDDKYIGVAVLLSTMPGLPMFGHGQIEGFTEKYGMEYRRSYYDEVPDEWLVRRHEQEIFPLLRQRHLWSGAQHFALFDFYRNDGTVDENVIAYGNRAHRDRGLAMYNNAYQDTSGTVRLSSAVNEGHADAPQLRQRGLAEVLALDTSDTCYYIFKDTQSGLEFLRHGRQIADEGLQVSIGAYGYHVFTHWTEIHDIDHSWGRLHTHLGGQGVPSMYEAYHELHLASVLEPFRKLMTAETLTALIDPATKKKELADIFERFTVFLEAIEERLQRTVDTKALIAQVEDLRKAALAYGDAIERDGWPACLSTWFAERAPGLETGPPWRVVMAYALIRPLGAIVAPDPPAPTYSAARTAGAWMREWFLIRLVARAFEDLDGEGWRAGMDARLVRIALAHGDDLLALYDEVWGPLLNNLFQDADVHAYLGVNHFNGRRWVNREQFTAMLEHTLVLRSIGHVGDSEAAERFAKGIAAAEAMLDAAGDTNYDLDWTLETLR